METNHTGRLPDFIAVGPPRTATTWLDRVLRRHVGLPLDVKETHFFARNYQHGLRWYEDHFRHCAAEQVVGEICAAYFENPQARERISTHLPNCKIVITLRDPVERLYSYYKLMRHNGQTELPFEEALNLYKKMLASSRYAFLLRKWHTDFGKENVLVVLNDDLAADSQAYLNRITDFIGIGRVGVRPAEIARNKANTIETAPRSAMLARNARQFRFWLGSRRMYRTRGLLTKVGVWRLCFEGAEEFPPLDPAVDSRLRDLLQLEVNELEDLLNRDLSNWKRSPSQYGSNAGRRNQRCFGEKPPRPDLR
jgi:Sulfotransferase domain